MEKQQQCSVKGKQVAAVDLKESINVVNVWSWFVWLERTIKTLDFLLLFLNSRLLLAS